MTEYPAPGQVGSRATVPAAGVRENRTLVPMGQSRLDRTWPAPRNTRFVYVLGEDRLTAPIQGLVVAWNRHRHKWRALVVRVDNPGLLQQVSIRAVSHLA